MTSPAPRLRPYQGADELLKLGSEDIACVLHASEAGLHLSRILVRGDGWCESDKQHVSPGYRYLHSQWLASERLIEQLKGRLLHLGEVESQIRLEDVDWETFEQFAQEPSRTILYSFDGDELESVAVTTTQAAILGLDEKSFSDLSSRFEMAWAVVEEVLSTRKHTPQGKGERSDCGLLFDAVLRNDVPNIKKIIHRGVNIDCRNTDDLTALHIAVTEGSEDAAIALIEQGASLRAKGSERHNALIYAIEWERLTVIDAILSRDPSIVMCDDPVSGPWPLWTAVTTFTGNDTIIKALLRAGADPDLANLDGHSPRDMARSSVHRERLQQLFAQT